MTTAIKQMVVPREKAVFWLDRNGRWKNEHGFFRNRKIIAFFHAHIRRDAGGYHLAQQRDGFLEKVYFRYEDTALFVFDLIEGEPVTLVLNTGRKLPLRPRKLVVSGDDLYMDADGERIKFVDRALLKISKWMTFDDQGYYIRTGRRRCRIAKAGSHRRS